LEDLIVGHRARCKFCSGKPAYYCEIISKSWYETYSDLRGLHKFQYELKWQKFDGLPAELVNAKVLRKNSKKGTCSTTAVYFKSFIKSYYTRILISCQCKRTIWQFNTHEAFNPSVKNRKLASNHLSKYKKSWMYGYINC